MILRIGQLAVLVLLLGQSAGAADSTVIKIVAKKFEFSPHEIVLKKGVPVVIQLSTLDRTHGFSVPSMKVRADIYPGKVTEVKLTPDRAGDFDFFCDRFCGDGHEDMYGRIKVKD